MARSPSPRVIAYSNTNTDPLLRDAATLPYTHYILSFLVPDGETDVKPSEALEAVLQEGMALGRVRAAGKKIMVSVGGGTVAGKDWLTMGQNATAVAESIAKVVEEHHLDGVDLDIEAVPYVKEENFKPYAEAAIALTHALARRLPGKLLTHAPQPPYLCQPGSSPECPSESLYAAILAATGEEISWLNMQYYSNPPLTSSDLDELAHYRSIVKGWEGFPGLAPERLVVGKPYASRVSGFAPLEEVTSKLLQPLAAEFGSSFGGFMAWEFNQDPQGDWAQAVNKVLVQP